MESRSSVCGLVCGGPKGALLRVTEAAPMLVASVEFLQQIRTTAPPLSHAQHRPKPVYKSTSPNRRSPPYKKKAPKTPIRSTARCREVLAARRHPLHVPSTCIVRVCLRARPPSGTAGHPSGVLCPSGVGPGLLRVVANTPIRSLSCDHDCRYATMSVKPVCLSSHVVTP